MSEQAAHSSWTDWMTAVATAVTAFFVALGWVAAVAASRRNTKRLLPTTELAFMGEGRSMDFGDFLQVRISITNRLDETIVIRKIIVRKPTNSFVSSGEWIQGSYIGQKSPALGETNFVQPNITIQEKVPTAIHYETPIDLYVVPPEGWQSGVLRLDVFVSSNADTIRNKRIVVKKDIKLPRAIKRAAMANKVG